MKIIEEIIRRFGICKKCSRSIGGGFKCQHHKGCCFGRWRAQPDNHCPEGKW